MSDPAFGGSNTCHILPHTLEICAKVASMSRVERQALIRISPEPSAIPKKLIEELEQTDPDRQDFPPNKKDPA